MALSNLDLLYRQVLVEYSQHPHHYGELAKHTGMGQGANASCGDRIVINVLRAETGLIAEIGWVGQGCAIHQASASMMSDLLVQHSVSEGRALIDQFLQLVRGDTVVQDGLDETVLLAGVQQFPARLPCATQPWHVMRDLLDEEKEVHHGRN